MALAPPPLAPAEAQLVCSWGGRVYDKKRRTTVIDVLVSRPTEVENRFGTVVIVINGGLQNPIPQKKQPRIPLVHGEEMVCRGVGGKYCKWGLEKCTAKNAKKIVKRLCAPPPPASSEDEEDTFGDWCAREGEF